MGTMSGESNERYNFKQSKLPVTVISWSSCLKVGRRDGTAFQQLVIIFSHFSLQGGIFGLDEEESKPLIDQ